MEAGCEPRKVTHDLRVGFIIRPTLSVPRLPGRRMIADRVPHRFSISVSFSLNLSLLPVHSLSESEGSGKFFGFRHISIDRQPCSAVARCTKQAETVIVNLTDE